MKDSLTIGLNARPLTKPEGTGVARYTRELLDALAGAHPDHEYRLFGVESVPESLADHGAITNAEAPPPTHSGLRAHAWEQTRLPLALREHDLDVFHTPGGNPPFLARMPLVTTVHDLSPVVHPEWFSRGYALLYRVTTPLAVRTSDRLVAVSGFTREELLAHYPSAEGRVTVVRNGVGEPPTPEPIPGFDDERFFLAVGADTPRKNGRRLRAAYRRYRAQVDDPAALVVTGPTREIFAGDGGDAPGVRRVGYVSEGELAWLYRRALALVYPSLYEGFGLPILEAMRAGTPVLTSDRGAMAEVADDDALLVDPTSTDALADGLARLATDRSLRERLAAAGPARVSEFSWHEAADRTVAVYRRAAGGERG